MAFKPFKILKGLLIKEENTNTPKQIEITPGGTANTKTTILSSQTTDKSLTLPDATDTLMGKATTDVMTNKTFDADGTGNSIINIENADIKAGASIDASKIANGSVSNAEFQQIDGLTSPAVGTTQSQTLTNKTISGISNTLNNIGYSSLNLSNSIVNADINTSAAIDATKIANGTVSNVEFQYLDGVTSAIQTQLTGKLSLTGGTLSGALDLGGNKITSLGTPTTGTDAVNKTYADGLITNLANKQLSNLGTTAVSSILTFAPSFAGVIASADGSNSSTMDVKSGAASAGTSGAVTISTGTATGNSGDILLQTGTSSATRGTIKMKEKSLPTASTGYVWTLQNISTGEGAWNSVSSSTNLKYNATNGQTINTGVNTLQYPTQIFDTDSAFSSNTTFTVPSGKAGKYYVYATTAMVTTVSTSTNYMQIFVNGSEVKVKVYADSYFGQLYEFEIEDTLNLSVGDTVTILFENNFGSIRTISTSSHQNNLTILKVG